MAHYISPLAEADLDDIWYYIATQSGSVEAADRLIDSLTRRFLLLANHVIAHRKAPCPNPKVLIACATNVWIESLFGR